MKTLILLLALCASVQAEVGVSLYTNGITQTASDSRYVNIIGDTMSGPLTTSTLTVTGNAFSVGGSTFVVANGKVGIGTTTPVGLFSVMQAANTSSSTYVVYIASSSAPMFTMDARGYIGVGKAPSSYFMDVNGALNVRSTLYGTNDTFVNKLDFYPTNPNQIKIDNSSDLHIRFYTNSTEAVRISSNGYVGIGVTVPTAKLQVSSGTFQIDGTNSPTVGYALCFTAAHIMGHCTDAPGVGGACTCVTP